MSKLISLEKTNHLLNSLIGSNKEKILIELNANDPPTVKQNTSFNLIDETGFGRFVSEPSADQTFTWGSGNFPAISDGTWYLYCSSNNETLNLYKNSTGVYGASKNAISYDSLKEGWYNSDGKVLAQFTVASSVVSDLIIFDKEYIYSSSTPSITPGLIGQKFFNTSNNEIYIAINTSSSSDWVITRNLDWVVETKVTDYQITISDFNKMFVMNPNTASQYGTLSPSLPTGSSSIVGRPFKIKHGANEGLIKIDVYAASGNKILYKGKSLDYLLLYSVGDSWELIWDGTNWSCSGSTTFEIGWINRDDWSNVHIGNGVTYDNKSAAVDWTGMTFSDGTNTATCVYDSGGTGASGILYFYNISGGTGVFTDGATLTAVNSDTADVDEGSGTSKNIDYNLYHGFGINITKIKFNMLYNTSASFTNSYEIMGFQFDVVNLYLYGWNLQNIDDNNIIVQLGNRGLAYMSPSGTITTIVSTDAYSYTSIKF